MYTLSRPAATDPQLDDTFYGLRPSGYAWVLAFQCLIMALPTLKLLHLFGADDLAWRWITLPFWGPSVLLAVLLLVERVTGFRRVQGQLLVGYVPNC
ncbi:MAG: hypothetical protein ACRYFZ_15715 [Janthinobacterium lividum]